MANILIADLLEASAYLIRSLLRGRGHAVSIAVSAEEARAKLETGLFDTLVVDLCEVSKENLSIAQFANDMLPGMPVVALTYKEEESEIRGIDIFGKIYRPIQGARVNAVVEQAIKHALNLGVRRTSPRISVDFPLNIEFGGKRFTARATDISDKGFAIDAEGETFTDDTLEAFAKKMSTERVQVDFMPRKGESYHASGRIAFVDKYRRYTGKMIGVMFEDVPAETRGYVDSLLKPKEAVAAAAPASGIVAS
ncbi:MAG: response regulator [Planctomycetes bacterium]|nr:response regulator [Planctomycetota bacterium]